MKHILLTTITAVVLVGCGGPPKDIWEAAEQGDIEAVKEYLAAGTDVNAKGDDGWTPLLYAAAYGHKGIVELLIAAGADVNAKIVTPMNPWDVDGETPLHYAANKETAELLIAEGADVNAKDEDGGTPLHRVAWKRRTAIAELLIAEGADVNAKTNDGVAEAYENLDPTLLDKGGLTPLDHWDGGNSMWDLLRKHGGKTKRELKAEGK